MRDRQDVRFFRILIVEDDPPDVRFLEEAFSEISTPHRLHVVCDGEEAARFLFKIGEYARAPTPDIVILDINMPKKDGHEVLRDIKSSPDLRQIVVIMFSSSGEPLDVLKAYDGQANCYIKKPLLLSGYVDFAKRIEEFWGRVAVLPRLAKTS